MGGKSQKPNAKKKSKENEAGKNELSTSTVNSENSGVSKHSKDLPDQEHREERRKSEQTATSTDVWTKKLGTVIITSGIFHVFQICGFVYLFLQITTPHAVSCCQYDSVTAVSDESTSSVCHRKTIDLSQYYKAQNNERIEDQEVFLKELPISRKSWEQVTTRINSMEKRIENMFQSFGDLQRNCSKTEEIIKNLQEVDRDFNRNLLDLQRNISKFQEEVISNISGLLNRSTWLEDKLQLFSKEVHNKTRTLIESKMRMSDMDGKKIYEQVMDGIRNTWKEDLLKMNATLKHAIEDTKKKFKIGQQNISSLINENVRIVKSNEAKVKRVHRKVANGQWEVKSSLSALRGEFGYLFTEREKREEIMDTRLHKMKADLEEATEKLGKVEKDVKIAQQGISTLTLDLKVIDETVANTDKSVKTISDHVQKHDVDLTKVDRTIGNVFGKLEDDKNEVDRKFSKVNKELNLVKKNVDETATKVNLKVDAEVKKVYKKVDEEKKRMESSLVGIHGQLDYFFRELKDINLYIVGILLLVVVGIIFVSYKKLLLRPHNQTAEQEPGHTSPLRSHQQQRVEEKPPSHIVDCITRRVLQPGITLISFNESTQHFHRDLIAKVPKHSSLYVQACNIKTTRGIADTKPFKLVFIFVDFNERNIILEDPATEIGDLRRMTTIGFQKMGCDVFVVYVKHRDSQTLQQDKMYSPRLQSVDRHSVLSELNKRRRVLSVYDRFHPHQVQFLEDCFKRL